MTIQKYTEDDLLEGVLIDKLKGTETMADEQTILVMNPWSKVYYQFKKEDMINPPDAFPFDPDICGMVASDDPELTDWDWVVRYAAHSNPEDMGVILLGS